MYSRKSVYWILDDSSSRNKCWSWISRSTKSSIILSQWKYSSGTSRVLSLQSNELWSVFVSRWNWILHRVAKIICVYDLKMWHRSNVLGIYDIYAFMQLHITFAWELSWNVRINLFYHNLCRIRGWRLLKMKIDIWWEFVAGWENWKQKTQSHWLNSAWHEATNLVYWAKKQVITHLNINSRHGKCLYWLRLFRRVSIKLAFAFVPFYRVERISLHVIITN